VAKTHGGSTPFKLLVPKPLAINTPQPPSVKKGTYGAWTSNQQPTDQQADSKKEADDKKVPVNPSNSYKKLQISIGLQAK
jgi:hypothetical protein